MRPESGAASLPPPPELGAGGGQSFRDAPRRPTVAIGRSGLGLGGVGSGVGQKAGRLGDDEISVRADEFGRPRRDALGALRSLAQDQNGLAEARGLLLDAARVGEDDGRFLFQLDEWDVVLRLDKPDARVAAEDGAEGVSNDGVAVPRHNGDGVGEIVHQPEHGAADAGHRLAPVLAPVGGHQYHAARIVQDLAQQGVAGRVGLGGDLEQGINDGIAGQDDLVLPHPVGAQIRGGLGRRWEMERRQSRRQQAVHFFGERVIFVARPQARLDVAELCLVVEGRQGGDECCRSVALGEHPVGFFAVQNGIQAAKGTRRHLR